MESEYNALSESMKMVLPLQELVKTVSRGTGIRDNHMTTFKTTVWEDNAGALTLANMEPGRTTKPRTKHYAVQMHWFCQHLKPNKVEVKKIDTKEQKADILTKLLRGEQFREIRYLLCGW